MLVRLGDKLEEQERKGLRRPGDLERAMTEQAYRLISRAARDNGQTETRIVKNKEVFGFASSIDLCRHLVGLWDRQGGRCRLTGLPMLLCSPEGGVNELVLSVDRIDSNRQYEPGNLQLVCWFINRWKGTTSQDQFMALIEILRGGERVADLHPRRFGAVVTAGNGAAAETTAPLGAVAGKRA